MVLTVAVVGKLDDSSCLLFFFFSAFLFSSVLFFFCVLGWALFIEPVGVASPWSQGAGRGAAHANSGISLFMLIIFDVNSELAFHCSRELYLICTVN